MTRNDLANPSLPRTGNSAEILRHESSILDALHDAVIVLDCRGIVAAWNHGAERTFGYRSSEAIGLPIAFLRFPNDLAHHHETFLSTALEHGMHRTIMRCRHKNRAEIFAEVRLVPLRDTTGDGRLLVACADVIREDDPSSARVLRGLQRRGTLERAVRRQAELDDRMRQHVAVMMAWYTVSTTAGSLGAVMNFASGLSRRLLADRFDREDLQLACAGIQKEVLRVASSVREQARNIQRVPHEFRPCHVNQLVEEAAELIDAEARADGVRFDISLAPEDPVAVLDALDIQQVLVNLARNGLEAMRECEGRHHTLSISTCGSSTDKPIEIRISDSGGGLSREVKDKLYTPFFTTKPHRLGMGLAVSEAILNAHHGRIAATANRSRGTTFTLTLPVDGPRV